MNSLKQLQDCGRSIWLDYIRRDLITSGEFQRLVEEDGVHGVTSNPTIFGKAIAAGTTCDDALRLLLLADPNRDALKLFEDLEGYKPFDIVSLVELLLAYGSTLSCGSESVIRTTRHFQRT